MNEPPTLAPRTQAPFESPPEAPKLFGVLAEFETAEQVLVATRRARQAGYRQLDAYTPYPVEGLAQELGEQSTKIPFVVLVAGIVGAGVGFFMQFYSMAVDYPINVGGRPLNSWQVFIPITFEMLILVASLSAFLVMLFLNGLPRPHHPLFNVASFVRASQDRFFLCIEATDPQFDPTGTADFLSGSASCVAVVEVPFEIGPLEPQAEVEVVQAEPAAL
jgi:hypothetical protein